MSQDSPVTEALLTKIGANCNGLIDRFNSAVVFTSSDTWTVPTDCTQIVAFLMGAGGGGGGGAGGTLSTQGGGGGGGAGHYLNTILTVTPGDILTVTIGAGGAAGSAGTTGDGGTGGTGGTSSITGTGVSISALGGGAGGGGGRGNIPTDGLTGGNSIAAS